MDSRRQLKLASVIKEAFTDILSRDGKAIYGKAFVTVTNVKITSDLSLARFYLSIYNATEPDAIIENFYKHKHELKRKLTEKVRHQLRVMPEIEFFRDETLDYAYHIEDLFKKIKEDDAKLKAEIEAPKPEPEAEPVKVKKAAAKKKAPAKKKAVAKKKTAE